MDSEDELLWVVAAVIIQREKTTKKKIKHRVWVQQIYREREKYGVLSLANQMRIYNRTIFQVSSMVLLSYVLLISKVYY